MSRAKGATTPVPVPHVMWKRGTELPWPSAPADDREPAHAETLKPVAHVARGPFEETRRQRAGVGVFGSVKLRGPHPIAIGQFRAVVDAHAALLGRVDHEEPAKRPERLSAKALRPFLIQQQNPAPAQHRFVSGHHAS
jgi:hypothetical protein